MGLFTGATWFGKFKAYTSSLREEKISQVSMSRSSLCVSGSNLASERMTWRENGR